MIDLWGEDTATIVAHDETSFADAVVPPIFQNSLFTFSSYQEMCETFAGKINRPVYTRGINPTVRAFEEKIAKLEGAEDALALSSGMAAISSAILSVVKPGDRILSVKHVYPDTFRFFEIFLRKFGVSVDYIDGGNLATVEAALPGHALFYLESPTSWIMEAHDVKALCARAQEAGVATIIDNSWASPIFQNPIKLDCDIVVHSASKYISGHSDVVAGVIATSAARVAQIRGEVTQYLGGKIAPFEAWLLLRGLRTLPIRMKAHEQAGMEIAKRLAEHPRVKTVFHPAFQNKAHPGLRGTSGLFSIELADNVSVEALCNHLKIFKMGVSWGGHESLICPAQASLIQSGGPNSTAFFGVSPHVVRLNVGLEDPEDLWGDLEEALGAASE
ncbi:PLP-dependent transferase [Pseudovibrio sp. Ad37]|uniref:PLP-dependent transferase n=1 Tax=Pseudovibrio sp. Ad37 TaxID=989422 RepID=UPI0007AE5BB0|nr:PLP-dependent transferase [Pseudovibrio sp. Ad37]KZL26195.1 Methionine gamma-lyase [Pseudovibrio sp. Ad37]